MQTVILCGGQGTRLKEETEFRPKPMVNIGPRPVLWHIMKRYAAFGHREFLLCLGYKGEMIKDYFYHYEIMNNDFSVELGRKEQLKVFDSHGEVGWQVMLANTGEKALKGARIKRVQKYVKGEEFMLTYGDGLADIDLDALIAFHRSHGKMVTLTGVNPASRFGEMKTEGDMVTSFREKPTENGELINGGYFVAKRALFDYLTFEDECDFEIGALEEIAKCGQLMVYRHSGSWACMDTLRDAEYLNNLWNSGNAFWKKW